MRVEGFWAGAAVVAERLALGGFVERAGGWEALSRCGPGEMTALGVPDRAIGVWLRHGPVQTRGVAIRAIDEAYPSCLRDLPDAPPVLFVEGDVGAVGARAVAVVGTRGCTGYGASVARDLGAQLAAAGWVVVSGLARGIDAQAHLGAASCGRTVAVLAHGLDHTAPQSHTGLRARILARGGAMVSTWFDAIPPRQWAFPNRNRWIAGLAERVVVVEAPEKSGAMHTVRAAADYGRDVHAVPGPLGAPASAGCLRLLSEGAAPLIAVREFVEGLGGQVAPRDAWLEVLFAGGSVDAAARVHGGSIAELLTELHLREARGELVRLPGQRYAKA